jgi:hypothetical protein
MKAWLEKGAWPFVMDRNGMPKVLRLYRDRKLGISDASQPTIDSKAASGPDLNAFKGKGPRSAAPQSGTTFSFKPDRALTPNLRCSLLQAASQRHKFFVCQNAQLASGISSTRQPGSLSFLFRGVSWRKEMDQAICLLL